MSCGIYLNVSPSGKGYVGQAVNIENRWNDFKTFGCLYSSENTDKLSAIDRARKKYNNVKYWKHYVLEKCEPEELNEKEIFWIDYLGTYRKGYNCNLGGSGNYGFHHSEQTKQKISENKKGHTSPMKGKTYEDIFGEDKAKYIKEKISANRRNCSGENSYWFGKKRDETTIKKISESRKGITPWNKGIKMSDDFSKKMKNTSMNIPILCYKYGIFVGEYISIIEASRVLKIGQTTIRRLLQKITKCNKQGYTFEYKK